MVADGKQPGSLQMTALNVEAIANAICLSLENEDARKSQARIARELICKKFNVQEMWARKLHLLNS